MRTERAESVVDAAIRHALSEGAAAYAARGIRVEQDLDAHVALATRDALLYHALHTVFRGLPDRLAPGSVLHVRSRSKAGGDVELSWNGTLERGPDRDGDFWSKGPNGDLFALAILALERHCRARLGWFEMENGGTKVLALVPSLERNDVAFGRRAGADRA